MKFETRVAGIPCICEVTYYVSPKPMIITGSGFGDAIAPELEEFEFSILDQSGAWAPWLEQKLTDQDRERLLQEYLACR